MADIAANLEQVRRQIAATAERAGRPLEDITLVTVSKTRPADEVAAAVRAGALDLGENYVQEVVDKQQLVAELTGRQPRWHFIGHLQRNKAKAIVPFCALIHSVDSARLAQEIDTRAHRQERRQPVLLQVDLAGEETKFGCPEAELPGLVAAVRELPHLDWQGLMTMPPLGADAEASRPYYRRLAKLSQDLLQQGVPAHHLQHLSMGMSNDYPVAIEEGATLVRIGTAIFGPRH